MKANWLASTALVAAVAVTSFGTNAGAAPISGSDSLILGVTTPSPAEDLLTALANGDSLNFQSVFFGTGAGDFANVPFLTPINNTTLSLSNLGAFSFTSSYGTFIGANTITVGLSTFSSVSTGSTGSAAGGSETISFYLVGVFNPLGPLAALGLTTDNASITLSLTETSGGPITPGHLGSFSTSLTIAAPAAPPPTPPPPPPPPPADVPEPASAMLLGAGLFGLGAMRRRSR